MLSQFCPCCSQGFLEFIKLKDTRLIHIKELEVFLSSSSFILNSMRSLSDLLEYIGLYFSHLLWSHHLRRALQSPCINHSVAEVVIMSLR